MQDLNFQQKFCIADINCIAEFSRWQFLEHYLQHIAIYIGSSLQEETFYMCAATFTKLPYMSSLVQLQTPISQASFDI